MGRLAASALCVVLCCSFVVPSGAQDDSGCAPPKLRLGSASSAFNLEARIPLWLSSPCDVQGIVTAFDWDGSHGEGVDLELAASLSPIGAACPDCIITRVERDYMVLVVATDLSGSADPRVIPGGNDILLAEAVIRCTPGPVPVTGSPVSFRDGAYATVDGGARLANLVVTRPESPGDPAQGFGIFDGLELIDGSFDCSGLESDTLTIESGGSSDSDPCGDVRVLMRNGAPVEGFVVAICHDDAGLELVEARLGAAAASADFLATEIDPFVGGVLGVVLDLVDPSPAGVVIPPGEGQHIASFRYCQVDRRDDSVYPLRFCEAEIGSPPKRSLIVVGGLSVDTDRGLVLDDFDSTWTAAPRVDPEPEDCDNGLDDDLDGAVDGDDPDCATRFIVGGRDADGRPSTRVEARVGEPLELCLWIFDPEDDNVGAHAQLDHLQGFSMALEYCAELRCRESIDTSGTILEALGAEFVSIQCRDGDPATGAPGELIVGVLIDALPPFDGATIAPSPDPQRVACVTFDVRAEAECGAECDVRFVDGLRGRGAVPIKNLVSAENGSRGVAFEDAVVEVRDAPTFYRGDCNSSRQDGGMAVDVSDAAAIVSSLFATGAWRFEPGCLDACDCQDDGRVDLADAVCVLGYLFRDAPAPPAPGPGYALAADGGLAVPATSTPPGVDPTADKLGCDDAPACGG